MICSSWDGVKNSGIGHFTSFFPYYPTKNPKSKFWKTKKSAGDIIILQCVPKITITWWEFLRYGVRQTEIFVILDHFLPFQPPQNSENKNFNTDKNIWSYYHFTHLHQKWLSYDYVSWDMECDSHNFLSFWRVLCYFPLLWTQKMNILKKN